MARIMAQKLGEHTGGTFIVENRPGGGGAMSTPEEFVGFIRAEVAKWTKVVREANIKVE